MCLIQLVFICVSLHDVRTHPPTPQHSLLSARSLCNVFGLRRKWEQSFSVLCAPGPAVQGRKKNKGGRVRGCLKTQLLGQVVLYPQSANQGTATPCGWLVCCCECALSCACGPDVWTRKTLGQKTNTILISIQCGSASRAYTASSRIP